MLCRIALAFAFCTGLVVTQASAAENLKANVEKSKIEFVGKKTDGEHSGGFKKFTAEATVVEEAPDKSSLKITIDTTSLFSDNPMLTAHLKNPDFFDVQKHPTITFESKTIKHDEDEGEATITGTLKMLGKEESLEVPVEVDANDDRIIVYAKFKLDRTKWGMTYGEGKINKDVSITASLQFDR